MFLDYSTKKINGINCMFVPFNTKLFNVSIIFSKGSYDESKKEKGIHHFIEHLLATELRESEKMNSLINNNFFINCNAFTSMFNTCFYLNCLHENQIECVNLLLKTLNQKNDFSKYFDREKKSILIEMSKKMTDVNDKIHIAILKLIFDNKNLYRDPIDHINNLENLNINTIHNYIQKHFNLRNGIIIFSGKLNVNKIVETIKKLKITNSLTMNYNREVNLNVKNKKFKFKNIIDKNSKLVNLNITFRTFETENKKKYVVKFISTLLSDIDSNSFLFKNLRIKLGITYSPHCELNINKYYGLLSISINIQEKFLKLAIDEIINIIKTLKTKKTDKKIINLVKSKLKYDIQKKIDIYEPSDAIHYGINYINKTEIQNDPKRLYAFYNSVTPADIIKISNEIFQTDNCVLVCSFNKNIDKRFFNNLKNL